MKQNFSKKILNLFLAKESRIFSSKTESNLETAGLPNSTALSAAHP